MLDLDRLLRFAVEQGASDVHVKVGARPRLRIDGRLREAPFDTVEPNEAEECALAIMPDTRAAEFRTTNEADFMYSITGIGRFRVSAFRQRGWAGLVLRRVLPGIPDFEALSLPDVVAKLADEPRGLVLVTGLAGSGKTATLAAMVDHVNSTRECHIITIEDPVEFIHANKEALVTQRQVPQHTASFARALKAALREDPDVILVGELRDLETMDLAITASETGHLVFGTLHTTNASATIDRLINTFPAGQQSQVRTMLADSLKAVISQALLPRRTGDGRVAAWEILRATTAVAALIRESKTYQLPSILQTGQLAGMMTLDQSLLKLVEEGKVSPEVAMDKATKKEPFEKLLEEERQALA
jgi:twitching motility protein PilT